VLQYTLAGLLTEPRAVEAVRAAAAAYRSRRTALQDALHRRGLATIGRDGYNVWVPLREPAGLPMVLARAGFSVADGGAFQTHSREPYCRVTVAALPEQEAPGLAALLAGAGRSDRSPVVSN
jgi:DNA-binding transcriptional MocR family regulator